MLVNHLGIVKGKELYREWTRDKISFSKNLELFNKRRFKKGKDKYAAFLKDKKIGFPTAWKRFMPNLRISSIYPYLGSKGDLKLIKKIKTSI